MHIQLNNSKLYRPESTHDKVDSQKIFIDNINQEEANYSDLSKRIACKVDSLTALSALDVTSDGTLFVDGTLVIVTGYGPYYYYASSTAIADGEEIVAPDNGNGNWIISGGGGSLVVDDDTESIGEDVDIQDHSIIMKIKKMFDKKRKSYFYPVTTSEAVYHTSINKKLSDVLDISTVFGDEAEPSDDSNRDSDTLGGHKPTYFAKQSDLDNTNASLILLSQMVNKFLNITVVLTTLQFADNTYASVDDNGVITVSTDVATVNNNVLEITTK